MRRSALLSAALVAVVLGVGAGDQRRTFGKSPENKAAVELTALAQSPRDFARKTVRVEGTVIQVDPEKGAWLDIANDATKGVRIRIRMPNGAAEFPQDAGGKHVFAEGLVVGRDSAAASGLPSAAEDLRNGENAKDPKSAEPQVAAEIQASGVVLE